MPDLLFEIGTEEIPAGYIVPALEALKASFEKAAGDALLEPSAVRVMGTPRRLTLHAAGLPEKQEDRQLEVSGPPKRIAFGEDGSPTKAAEGFARKNGIDVSAIQILETKKGEYCFAVLQVEGLPTKQLLSEILPGLLQSIPFPKSMYWKTPTARFARPVRSLAALLGNEVVPFEFNGLAAGARIQGHPFLSSGTFPLESASLDGYQETLRRARVIADVAERKASIEDQLAQFFRQHGSTHNQPALVDEVTNLVEWPHVLEGSFAAEFLEVPPEVIETAMMSHQRYFPVRDAQGQLLNRFVVVSNRDGAHDEVVREGNERVLRARLADARFFWNEDRKRSLGERVDDLKDVLYQEKLGSYYDRTERLRCLAGELASTLDLSEEMTAKLLRSAELCKADLLTQMVVEFPTLQGVIGRAYALEEGEDPEVAAAIEEHYLPKQAGGALPETPLGLLLALAEKADTVSACFAAGLAPTSNQDPYGLRRQTLGIIRLVIEKRISFSLSELFATGLGLLPESMDDCSSALPDILAFVKDRLYHFCIDREYRYDLVNACLAPGFDNLLDFMSRVEALTELAGEPYWEATVEIVERTFNITRGKETEGELSEALLQEPEEKQVYQALAEHGAEIEAFFENGKYTDGARSYHQVFAEVLHRFFEDVFVDVDDAVVRNNRLLLVKSINRLFAERFADLTQVVVERK